MSVPAPLGPTLVCFAVSQEAKAFQRMVRGRSGVLVQLTGMGARNAEQAIRAVLRTVQPIRVFTCGFAGALNPDLNIGDVVFTTRVPPSMAQRLQSAGARQAAFTGTELVVTTAVQKRALYEQADADVVEMESATIERVCRETGIECITVRAISDTAHEDLPLDFNKLMTTDQKLDPAKLALEILRRPQKIPALLRLGKNSSIAAEQIAKVLIAVI